MIKSATDRNENNETFLKKSAVKPQFPICFRSLNQLSELNTIED